MNLRFLTIGCFCMAACSNTYAQWDGSAVNTTTSSNVGIGLTAPTSYLHILQRSLQNDVPKIKIEGQFSDFSFAQPNIMEVWNTVSATPAPYFLMDPLGRLALGTTPSVNDRLTLFGHMAMMNDDDVTRYISAHAPKAGFGILENTNHWDGPSFLMYGTEGPEEQYRGALRLISHGTNGLGTSIENYDKVEDRFIPRLKVMNDGMVYVGEQPPADPAADRLTVYGHINMQNAGNVSRYISAHAPDAAFGIVENTNHWDGPSFLMYGKDNSESQYKGTVRLISYGENGLGTSIESYNGSDFKPRVKVMNNGQVIIGDQAPSGDFSNFLLGVDGKIVCKSAVVQIKDWADFVFSKEYKLPNLNDVEAYIQENNHLPDVPSERHVMENGIDVGGMNKILLQKVEELTLYMIQLKKDNDAMKVEIAALQKK